MDDLRFGEKDRGSENVREGGQEDWITPGYELREKKKATAKKTGEKEKKEVSPPSHTVKSASSTKMVS